MLIRFFHFCWNGVLCKPVIGIKNTASNVSLVLSICWPGFGKILEYTKRAFKVYEHTPVYVCQFYKGDQLL